MAWDFNKVAIVGSGAIGLYYGGRLAEAGGDVSFLARSDFDEISGNGIRAESVAGGFHLPEAKVFRSAEETGAVDLVIVAWKATANGSLGAVLPPLLHAGTQVLTLQNGLGNCESVAEIVGAERVCGGLCFVCINRIAPGTVSHTSGGRLTIGEFAPGVPGRAEILAARFREAKIPAAATENLLVAQWEKLIWNVPFNGLSVAEGGKDTKELLADPRIEAEIRRLMEEVVAAARAQGISLDQALVDKNIERTRPMDAYRPSTMIDFLEGRELELGPIWEEPMRRAKAAGVEMAALEKLLLRMKRRLAERG
ncbi:2-dehydropantoate 2-reductase [Akkermansiaceae bacterium]|nr:2-dehydropantoate 2-reductase [Akkermansiaceae bacterium]